MKYLFRSLVVLLLVPIISFSTFGNERQVPGDSLFSSLAYRNVGPTRGGRVTSVAGVPGERGTYYMGSTGGGMWKTTDYGITWKNISDSYFLTPSIGSIAVAPSEDSIVYVGTGTDGLRSNLISGKGVYKSEDSGHSWKRTGLAQSGQIGAVVVDRHNANRLFVAAIGNAFMKNKERGVYRSLDGGTTWEQVLYLSDSIGAVDIELAPDNPDMVYAAFWRAERKPWTIISGGYQAGGVYKSIDGGKTWAKKTKGLPSGLIGKIDLAVSVQDPQRLYALVEAPKGEGGLYRSDDRGESFVLVSTRKELINRPFYYCNVYANPQNANSVYVMANRYMHSTDGGKTWKNISSPHGDNHDMWMDPTDSLLFIESNDGGANVTVNGGKTWSSQFNQPTAELYQVEADDQFPYWLYAGQQDNTTITVPSLPPYNAPGGPRSYWLAVGGCETGPAIPKPGNPNIIYSNCKGRFGVYNKLTGQEQQYYIGATNIYGHNPRDLKYRFQRVAPIYVSSFAPHAVYMGSQYLHKTLDDGKTWTIVSPDLTANEPDKQVISGSPITRDITGEEYYSVIYAIRESPLKEGLLWVGANDGPVQVSPDGGKTWNEVTPEGIGKGGRVDCVEPSPHSTAKAYIAVLRYQLGDYHPYILKTTNNGQSWKLLTDGRNGIPKDFPTRVVREDPEQEGLLYAGTEYGLFVSFDDGASWKPFQQNLPITPVTDIKIKDGDLLISTMGRSFWVLDDLTPVRSLADGLDLKSSMIFKPRDTYMYRYRPTNKKVVPYYPPSSVILNYYVASEPINDVTIDISSESGNHVTTLTSYAVSSDSSKTNSGMENTRFGADRAQPLSKSKGLHRYRWDMKYQGAWDKDLNKSFKNGPRVAPGKYLVKLTVAGKSSFTILVLKPDPRVLANGVSLSDIEAQVKLSLKIRNLLAKAKKLEFEVSELMAGMTNDDTKNKKKKLVHSKRYDRLVKIKNKLIMQDGNYMQPMLIDQLNYLAGMLNRADQRPGKDAYDRYSELLNRFNEINSSYENNN